MQTTGTGIVTGIALAGVALVIAEVVIAHIKLRMELLPRRLEIFAAFNNYLTLAMTRGTTPDDKETAVTCAHYSKIGFFFDDDVKRICEEIVKAEFERASSDRSREKNGEGVQTLPQLFYNGPSN